MAKLVEAFLVFLTFMWNTLAVFTQARRQDLAAGRPKTRRGQKPEGEPHF